MVKNSFFMMSHWRAAHHQYRPALKNRDILRLKISNLLSRKKDNIAYNSMRLALFYQKNLA